MEPLAPILTLIAGAPTGSTAVIGTMVMLALIYLKFRHTGLESVTSISKLQSAQVEELIKQNRSLAADLEQLRNKMAETLNELYSLRVEVSRLRSELTYYETNCTNCKKRPEALR